MNHPDTFAYLEMHGDDAYSIPWSQNRATYYASTTYPTAWFDGKIMAESAYLDDEQQYNWYLGIYQQRLAVPTDVSVQLGGGELDPNAHAYRITARIALDRAGTAKTVRVYILHALDHYPRNDIQYRFCVRPPAPTQTPWWVADVLLSPGQFVDIQRDLTFDWQSWAYQSDISIVAWAQKPASSGANGEGEVWNSQLMTWPFPPLPARGDLNCDGALDFADIDPFVLAISDPASYEAEYPDCHVMLGDIHGDGALNFDDIDPFIELLSGGGRQ